MFWSGLTSSNLPAQTSCNHSWLGFFFNLYRFDVLRNLPLTLFCLRVIFFLFICLRDFFPLFLSYLSSLYFGLNSSFSIWFVFKDILIKLNIVFFWILAFNISRFFRIDFNFYCNFWLRFWGTYCQGNNLFTPCVFFVLNWFLNLLSILLLFFLS